MANNKLVTSYFRLHNVRQFIESIDEPANTIYYVFGGKPDQYSTGDNNIDRPTDDINTLRTAVYDEMVFAKKITRSDVAVMVNRNDWTAGTVYDMYDDRDEDLENKDFYVVSQEGDIFYIFKCLFNNNGQPSTSKPLYSATSADDPLYTTSDGYIWKYLFKLDRTTYNKFSTPLYVPVIKDSNVSSNAVPGSIDVIKIEDEGKFYNNYLSGTFVDADTNFDGTKLKHRITASAASETPDFYKGCIIKIISGTGAGQYRTITGYTLEEGVKFIFIDTPFTTEPKSSVYQISPQIMIYGDRRQSINTVARALINSSSGNSVYQIDILDRGKDYFIASANVYAEPVVRISNTINDAVLRPIISPRGGHGYDAETELYGVHLGISVKFSNNENGNISTDNDFRTIGVLKDPKFNNVKVNYNDLKGDGFVDNEEIVQLDLKKLGGGVQVSSTSKNVVGLGTLTSVIINSAGNTLYANSDIITISNVAVNAVCDLTTNSSGYIASIDIVSKGFGFADEQSPVISISNSSGGNIRHVNTRILSTVTAFANGRSYSNDDYLVISGVGVSINASANITTNSIGGITSVVLDDRGKGFNQNEIAVLTIAANGRGYNSTIDNQVAFSGGDGTGATAYFTNNSTGNIVSIILTNPGYGYTSAPTVTPAGSPTVAASITATLVANSISLTFANSTGGYANGAKVDSASVTSGGTAGLYSNSDYIIFPSPSSTHGNAVASVVTLANGALDTINVNAGNNFGFSYGYEDLNPYVANSTGGKIRYLNSNIVGDFVVSNSSPSYRVNGVTITSGGSGYNSTKILRVDIANGGVGYNSVANNVLFFSGGSGSEANATFVNNSLGTITAVTIVTSGNGYISVPTVQANATARGVGANLIAVLANSITFTSTTRGYGAVAYFGNNASGTITSISIANSGFNYTTAPSATVSDPVGINAVLAPTITGGANNFNSSDIIYVTNGSINSVASITANATNFLSSIVVTNSGKDFSPTTLFVYSANSTGYNIRNFNGIIIKELIVANGGFIGFCGNTDVLTISGGTANAIANITSNSVGGLQSVNLLNSGLGFANHSTLILKLTNSSGGDIRYLNDYIVNSVSISDSGSGYDNADYIIVTSKSGGVNAVANIETSTTGAITSIQFKNKGKKVLPSYISTININDGGSGYSNADLIDICGGGGTGANAVLLTNSSGGIVEAFIVDGGINYDCAPSISIANSIGGVANGIGANLTATIKKPYSIRIFDANNNPSNGSFADVSITVSLSANISANLIYAPTLGDTSSIANVVTSATIETSLVDSANFYYTSILTPDLSVDLSNETTSFSSSLGAGDYIFLQTNDQRTNLLQVNSVTNSSHLVVTTFPSFSSKSVAMSGANVHVRGNVLDQSTGYINVTNVTGFFTQSNIIYGLASKSSANATNISFNNISKSGSIVNQLFCYKIDSTTGTFEEDEIVFAAGATAKYHSGNGSVVFVTEPNGLFYPGNTITGNSSGATAELSSGSTYKYEGDFVRGSGDIIYIENIEPISRSNNQSETIKLILEF